MSRNHELILGPTNYFNSDFWYQQPAKKLDAGITSQGQNWAWIKNGNFTDIFDHKPMLLE